MVADDKLFSEAESHFVDAKFYLANMVLAELSSASSLSYKHSEANNLQISKTNVLTKAKEENNQGGKHHVDGASKKNGTLLLRYVPKVNKMKSRPRMD